MARGRLFCMTLACVLLAGCGKRDVPDRSAGLRDAASKGDLKRVRSVLSRGVDVNGSSRTGQTALHEAVYNGHAAVVQLLLTQGANVHAADKYGSTPLHEAAHQGHKELAELLVASGARVDPVNRSGWTPAMVAMSTDHRALVEYLVNAGAVVTLHMAAYLGDVAKTKALIAKGADVRATIDRGWTPLHYAAQGNQRAAAEVLLASGANVDAPADSGATPLHVAASKDSTDVAQLLLTHGADVNATQEHAGTALHAAAYGGNVRVAKVLISGGADVNADPSGGTPLCCAAQQGWTSMVELLLAAGADANIEARYKSASQTALHIAVDGGYIGVVRLLAPRIDDINRRDSSGCTPLHRVADAHIDTQSAAYEVEGQKADPDRMSEDRYAILNEDENRLVVDTIEVLLAYGADVNAATDTGRAPLHEPVFYNGPSVAQLLIDHGANVNAATQTGRTALHIACASMWDSSATVSLLVDHGAEVNAATQTGETPLHVACAHLWDSESTVRLLLDHGADINAKSKDGRTPLAEALQQGRTVRMKVARLLIAAGAEKVDMSGLSEGILHKALRDKNHEWMKLSLENGADVNERDRDPNTPLHVAVAGDDVCFMRLPIRATQSGIALGS